MYYKITEEITEVGLDELNDSDLFAACISLEELQSLNERFAFSPITLRECHTQTFTMRNSLDVFLDYSFGIINRINPHNLLGGRDRIAFYVSANLFLVVDIVDEDKSTLDLFDKAVHYFPPEKSSVGKMIYAFFESMICQDNRIMEERELELEKLEDQLISGEIDDDFNEIMLNKKKELSVLKNYYEQLIDIGEDLEENANNIFQERGLYVLRLLTRKLERLSGNVQELKEYIVQIRDTYQASMDYNLNNTMKLFTVVTTIFLPLTLIVGWYGMNFSNMPELALPYAYPVVIILSIVVVVVCIWFFKKKKLL